MQFKEWLKRKRVRAAEVADAWGRDRGAFSRILNGSQLPPFDVVYAAFEMTQGDVGIADWAETCRPLLGGLLKDGKISGGSKKEIHIGPRRGRPPGVKDIRPRVRKAWKAARFEEQGS